MRKIVALIVLLLVAHASTGALLSTQPPVCTVAAPSQASSAGLTILKYCNPLTSIPGVIDVNNTLNPWYLIYPTGFNYTMPPSDLSVSASGFRMASIPSQNNSGIYSVAYTGPANNIAAVPQYTSYSGATVTGAFYLEVEMQLDPTYCSTGSNANPSVWTEDAHAQITSFTNFSFTEIDILEYINCVAFSNLHWWTVSSGVFTDNCTNSTNKNLGYTEDANFHKYGVLVTSNAITTYIDNAQKMQTTNIGVGTTPSPAGTCSTGAYSTIGTQPWVFIFQPGTGSPITVRNVHIWQAS